MIEAGLLLVGILLGYALCWLAVRTVGRSSRDDGPKTVLVKRSKPSLRSPLQTHKVAYEPYLTKSGLYKPIKPGEGVTNDETKE